MNGPPNVAWLKAFLATNFFELPVYVLILRKHFGALWAPCLLTLCVNSCTHPLLWFLVPQFDPGIPFLSPYVAWAVVAESGVVVMEAAMVSVALSYFGRAPRPPLPRRLRIAFLSSLTANLLSTLLGLALSN